MKTMKPIFTIFLILSLAIVTVAMKTTQPQKAKPWVIPDKYKEMKNPVKSSDDNLQTGETLYHKNCVSCHGRTGAGDGIKAKNLDTFPGDFTSTEFQNQYDGALFYESKFGRGDMPKYENKIEDNDIWTILLYIRTLKK